VALIDELLSQIEDESLRAAMAKEVSTLRQRMTFGLVFDKHIPETANVTAVPICAGMTVRRRDEPDSDFEYLVESISGSKATLRTQNDAGKILSAEVKRLVAVKRFGEPVFPGLKHVETVSRSAERPVHMVIEGENYHALQMFSIFGQGSIDCIYLDPPYNTGATDWKYSNRFVDKNDSWRHSKWLSFMERRLILAQRLLKPDGVLVVSINEHEHAHLVCLLEDLFKGWDIASVAIVHNPRGVQGDNFSYSNDFAVFVTPPGKKVIAAKPVDGAASQERRFRVWGKQSERSTAKNCFFPILVQDENIVGFGEVPPDHVHPAAAAIEQGVGRYEVWPIDNSGVERKWRNQRKTIEAVAHLLSVERVKGRLEIRIDKETGTHKTVWSGSRHDGGSHGKRLVKAFGVNFDYPKSLYTMRDILFACTGNNKEAVVLDFFAGSGTTLHAICLLNAEDGGARRCILVTNNEVDSKTTTKLNGEGLYAGDPGFEKHGIFDAVTRPRCKAAITGIRPDGKPVAGLYEGGRPRADGFEENVEFLALKYLDPDRVELGQEFSVVHPMLWLAAGAAASRRPMDPRGGFAVDAKNGYAVLFDDARITVFANAVMESEAVKVIFHVTNDEGAFAELVSLVGVERSPRMLYRDLLAACRTNAIDL